MNKLKIQVATIVLVGLVVILGVGTTATTASAMVVFTPKLTVGVNRTVVSATYEKGSEADMIGVTLTASSGSVVVKGLTFHMIADNDASFLTVENDVEVADHISDCFLTNPGGSVVAGPEALSEAGELVFEDLVIGIGRGRTKTYKVSCDLANVDVMSGNNDIYALTVISDSDVIAETVSGLRLIGRSIDVGGLTDPGVNMNGRNVAITVEGSDSSLTINESSTPSTTTYVKGTSAASLVGYSFTAGTSHDITVSDVTFTGTGDEDGTFSNENDIVLTDKISSCSVYDGATGSLIDGPEAVVNTSSVYTIPFNDFSWTVSADETSKLILKCNLADVAPDGTDVYKFFIGATDSVSAVTAEDEEGDSVITSYDVNNDGLTNTADDLAYDSVGDSVPTITISDAGTLTVSTSADTPTSTIILGNSTDVTVHKVKFTSTNEAFTINKVTFDNVGSSDAGVNSIKISYTNSEGITETKTGYLSSTEVVFNGMDLYVAKDYNATLTVMVETAAVDSSTISGSTLALNFDSASASDFEAVGEISGTSLDGTELSGVDPVANLMTLYKTKPTISLSSGSPAGLGIPGLNEVFRFNIAADSRGYVTVDELTFKLNTTAKTAGSTWNVCDTDGSLGSANGFDDADFSLYDVSDLFSTLESADTDWKFLDGADTSAVCTEDTDVVDYVVLDLTVSDEIAAGSSVSYVLKIDTTGASSVNDDSIRIDLPADSEVAINGGADPDGTIIWSDDAYDTNIDGTLIRSLPVYGGTITY